MPDISTQPSNCIHRDNQKNSAYNVAKSAGIFVRKATHSYLIVAVIIAVMSPTFITGQSTLHHARTQQLHDRANLDSNILQSVRSLTTRATITVKGRDQGRFLTVFTTQVHGYVEFGFPTPQRRPFGSLELFDATSLTKRHYPSGVRKVAISHSCSNLHLTVDKYGQARACQVTGGKTPVFPLNRNTHCVDGRKFHVCTDTPHIYLDSQSIYWPNSTDSTDANRTYKIRFVKPSTKTRYGKVLYAVVTRSTWELKLRAQNGIMKRAVIAACLQLWQKSIHLLFQHAIESRSERNFNLAKDCDIDPDLVVEEIIQSLDANDLTQAIHQAWRHHALLDLIGTSKAWSHMNDRDKEVIAVIAYRTLKKFLVDAFLDAANMKCIRDSRWGRMAANDRLILLERTLTWTWFKRRVKFYETIVQFIEKYLDARTTSFVINQNG